MSKVLYHTTSWSGLAGILEAMELRPRRDAAFVSLAQRPVVGGDIRANDVVLELDAQLLGDQVQPVQYTKAWYRQHPEHAAYIAGEGWVEQYVAPDDCFEYDEESDEEIEDQDCLDEAREQAEIQAFLDKRGEQEWISVQPYASVVLGSAVTRILVTTPHDIDLALRIVRQHDPTVPVESMNHSRTATLQYRGHLYREALKAPTEPQGPRLYPPGPANPPGPRLTTEDFVDLGALSQEEFAQEAADLADQMVHECRRGGRPSWCCAANGILLGQYDDEAMARKVVEHWLFLKSKTPNRQVHMGQAFRRAGVSHEPDGLATDLDDYDLADFTGVRVVGDGPESSKFALTGMPAYKMDDDAPDLTGFYGVHSGDPDEWLPILINDGYFGDKVYVYEMDFVAWNATAAPEDRFYQMPDPHLVDKSESPDSTIVFSRMATIPAEIVTLVRAIGKRELNKIAKQDRRAHEYYGGVDSRVGYTTDPIFPGRFLKESLAAFDQIPALLPPVQTLVASDALHSKGKYALDHAISVVEGIPRYKQRLDEEHAYLEHVRDNARLREVLLTMKEKAEEILADLHDWDDTFSTFYTSTNQYFDNYFGGALDLTNPMPDIQSDQAQMEDYYDWSTVVAPGFRAVAQLNTTVKTIQRFCKYLISQYHHFIANWEKYRSGQDPRPHDAQAIEVMWHATTAYREIMAEGFKTQDELGNQATGLGGAVKGISFTADKEVADAIALAIRDVVGLLQGPHRLQDILAYSTEVGLTDAQVVKILTHEFAENIPDANTTLTLDVTFNLFKWCLTVASENETRYNPLFFMVRAENLARVKLDNIGVIEAQIDTTKAHEYLRSMEEWRVPKDAILQYGPVGSQGG